MATDSSGPDHRIESHSSALSSIGRSSGPFTMRRPSCPSVRAVAALALQRPTCPRQHAFASRIGGYPASYPKRPPAFASWASLLARDFRPSHDRPTNRPTTGPLDPDQVSMFRTRETRLRLAVLSTPGTAVSTRPKSIFDRRLPPLNGRSLSPCPATRRQGVRLTRHQPRIHCRSAHAQPSHRL